MANVDVPPIFVSLVYLLSKFLSKPAVAYCAIRLSNEHLSAGIPTWATVVTCLLIQPVLYFSSRAYKTHAQKAFAKSHGAVITPKVAENPLQITRSVVASFTNDPVPGEIFSSWAQAYGNAFTFETPGETRIFTLEPEHVKATLATQFDKFVKGPILHDQWKNFLGDGIFNADGSVWKFHRGMTRPFFHKDRISDYDTFDRHATSVISLMKERMEEGYAVDFQDAIGRFTFDSASEYLFGADVKSLGAGLVYPPGVPNPDHFLQHPSNEFVNSFMEAQFFANRRSRTGPHWRLVEPWKDEVKIRRATMDKFLDPLLHAALKKKAASSGMTEKEIAEDGNLLDHLVRDTEDHTIIKDELLNMLLAGRDTTAGTLCWAVYMLAEHPEITKRLRKEISEKIAADERPTYEQIREVKYLRAFLDETLRLFPSVPFDARVCTEDTIFPGVDGKPAIFVGKDTRLMYSAYWMQRRTDLWGPDALLFDPDRWLDARLKKYYLANPYIFVPFNAGPRICLGQQFAYNEMSFFLVKLLQGFSEFSLAGDVQPESSKTSKSWVQGSSDWNLTFKVNLTMSVKGGMWVRMK